MRELMIEAEYAPFAPDWFLETASRWFTVQKTPCLQTAEAVIGEPTLEALQNAPQLRWLQMTWAGADRYLHGGFPRGVLLTTASGAFGETIAEHAIGMLLALCRRLPAYARQGNWNDLGSERRETYRAIRETWLAPCYEDLQNGRLAQCKDRYVDMVRTLEHRFLS